MSFPWPVKTIETSCVQCGRRETVHATAEEIVNRGGEPAITKWMADGWNGIMRRLKGRYAGVCLSCSDAIDSGKCPMFAIKG